MPSLLLKDFTQRQFVNKPFSRYQHHIAGSLSQQRNVHENKLMIKFLVYNVSSSNYSSYALLVLLIFHHVLNYRKILEDFNLFCSFGVVSVLNDQAFLFCSFLFEINPICTGSQAYAGLVNAYMVFCGAYTSR